MCSQESIPETSNSAVRAGHGPGGSSRSPSPAAGRAAVGKRGVASSQIRGGREVEIRLVLIFCKSSGNHAREKGKGVTCVVVAEKWKIPLYDASESLDVGQGGDGHPGWTPRIPSPQPRASCAPCSGPSSPITEKSPGDDSSLLQGQVTLLQDSHFCCCFCHGAFALSLVPKALTIALRCFLNPESPCCLRGLIEALSA